MRMPVQARRLLAAVLLLSAAGLGGCATVSPGRAAAAVPDDPLEGLNRGVFEVNQAIDASIARPVAAAYSGNVPADLRQGLSNALSNLREPYSFVNDLLQARSCQAAEALIRFLVNSTVGIAGVFDVAGDHLGIGHHDNDFGLTLAAWGIPDGPYLVLPLLGPSNLRDAGGAVLEWFAEPVDLAFAEAGVDYLSYVRAGLEALDDRADALKDLDHLNATALDRYAAYRSAARQSRTRAQRAPRCQL
ncbi:MlaA family lipoprotein [Zavarzinia compransoris]|uniref:ABC transporter n=1 Tax=Zavarzinia compransoris TaxID=1264899 RepID=A0A317ECW4_9PROT|nr:VacJ family lipoprotein [Zavarzinia compransoris]PWR23055.1 hypothetical protein DKG75_00305 [Zavarzinia compransoris]TDP46400.1 phospholipid-binding lipoprotein MlaA [Zavarzinia compransoris]